MIQIDIEMPKTCCDCPLHDGEYGWCNLNYDITMDCEERPKECPIHEVTDTDTISRQAAYDTLTEYYHHRTEVQHMALREALSRVPPSPSIKPDTDTISRKQAIDAIDILRGGCITDDVKNFVRYQLLGLPPSTSRPPWIPCSERLPEHSCQTLVTTKWDTEYSVEYGFYWGEDNKWGTITNNVIAWMPLPQPYCVQ